MDAVPALEVHDPGDGGRVDAWDLLRGTPGSPDDTPHMTYAEIAELLGLTPSMVRQIEQRALAKLRGDRAMRNAFTAEEREARLQAHLNKRFLARAPKR